MSELFGERAALYDIDNTLVSRGKLITISGGLNTQLSIAWSNVFPSAKVYSLSEIPVVNHTLIDSPIRNLKEKISHHFHTRRRAFPGVPVRIKERSAAGIHNFGNTGRKATWQWATGTGDQLEREGYNLLQVFYTPRGVPTWISKGDGVRIIVQGYEDVEMNDDHWPTIIFLAPRFPTVRFNFIDHGLSRGIITKEVLSQNPNIRVVPISDWVRPDFE